MLAVVYLRKLSLGFSKLTWLVSATVVALLILAVMLFTSGGQQAKGSFNTEEVVQGNLESSISASGTLQPTHSVDVGSELSGTLEAVLVNENDNVVKGQVLARLDTSKLNDAVVKSRGVVAAADATVQQMNATVAETRANYARMKQVAELSGGKVPSKTELATAKANWQRAEANLASARASVDQARAALKTDETNIAKAKIRSPINGVVLARKVEPGQTVAAAMTTPVLFTLAEDLTKMELQVKVDEADVGNVKLGQSASFTVATWPNRQFPATITRVGIGSTVTDNVVTYKTVLSVANDDYALRPGMTATAQIITAKREQVLLVPNAALRFTPPSTAEQSKSFLSRIMPQPRMKRPSAVKKSLNKQVWVLQGGQPVAVPVEIGVSNGRQTEITGDGIKAGTPVITDYVEQKS